MKVRFILSVTRRKFFFFTSTNHRGYKLWSCQNVCDALSYLLANISMGSNCAPLVADLFLFCYERYCITYLSDDNHANIIEAFK